MSAGKSHALKRYSARVSGEGSFRVKGTRDRGRAGALGLQCREIVESGESNEIRNLYTTPCTSSLPSSPPLYFLFSYVSAARALNRMEIKWGYHYYEL